MRIGIDAKWFFTGNASGRVVIFNLIKAISKQDLPHTFIIILDKKDRNKEFPFQSANFEFVYVWANVSLLSNIFVCPIALYSKKLDICLFPYFVPLFCNFKKVALIFDVIFESSPHFFSIKERIYFKPIKYLVRNSDGIITISNNEKNRMKAYGYYTKKSEIEVIYLGVDEKFKPLAFLDNTFVNDVRNKYKLPNTFILYLGRLNERKNIHTLVKAFSLTKDKNTKLVLGGTYDRKMFNLPLLLEQLNLTKRVILTGFVADDEMPVMYSLCKVFCYLSFDEGFGIPPIEAMASGVPVIVSEKGSLKEVCENAGFLVDPSDVEGIAKLIDDLMSNQMEVEQKILAGINRAAYFNWNNTAKSVIHYLESRNI